MFVGHIARALICHSLVNHTRYPIHPYYDPTLYPPLPSRRPCFLFAVKGRFCPCFFRFFRPGWPVVFIFHVEYFLGCHVWRSYTDGILGLIFGGHLPLFFLFLSSSQWGNSWLLYTSIWGSCLDNFENDDSIMHVLRLTLCCFLQSRFFGGLLGNTQ